MKSAVERFIDAHKPATVDENAVCNSASLAQFVVPQPTEVWKQLLTKGEGSLFQIDGAYSPGVILVVNEDEFGSSLDPALLLQLHQMVHERTVLVNDNDLFGRVHRFRLVERLHNNLAGGKKHVGLSVQPFGELLQHHAHGQSEPIQFLFGLWEWK